MKRTFYYLMIGVVTCTFADHAIGRGWGGRGFSRGGFSDSYGRSSGGGYGRSFSSFSGSNRYGGSYSGSRSTSSYSGLGGRGAASSYDHSWSDARGGSMSTSGNRASSESRNGFAAGGRDTSVTTAWGKTYSADRQAGVASGPFGRTVGGASDSVNGRYGTSNWNTAFAGHRYGSMQHYSSFNAATAHGTSYWSNSYTTTHAAAVRSGFGYYNCFHPSWYTAHPGCWAAAGWSAGAAWTAATYPAVSSYCGIAVTAEPPDYDYGSNVVINDDSVTVNGVDQGAPQQFATQATTIADNGQTAAAPPTDNWKPLGVYALVQGDEKTSNNIFQLAVNANGIIRGNYYDGFTDTTTEVYGSVDKRTQRAAWTIGKTKDRVYEAGIYNLTKSETPVLVHFGTSRTQQMLLVSVPPSKSGN